LVFISVPDSLSDYDYPLPEDLIARHPLPDRDASRMMVLNRAAKTTEHRTFADFSSYLRPDDLVVLNDTRVIPAKVSSDDGRIGLLFLEAIGPNTWTCLVKPGRRMKLGAELTIGGVHGVVRNVLPDGQRVIAFDSEVDLESCGRMPLPPYLEREAEPDDSTRYQTVFARTPGAVAAPTAGLHFTPELLAGIPHAFVTLHVGLGTFRPVQVENLAAHRMHSERFSINEETADRINAASRIVAVGTTTTRVLESIGRPLRAESGSTDIFIRPPYNFQVVGALLTNFHLPKSTLLMLISAFAGHDFIRRAYDEAIRFRYRFFSYGDCMLIL
jgi:S-adenosylmethionine:tRNA ribosyltransferase-isomerase